MDIFDKLAKKIKSKVNDLFIRLKTFLKRLLFPLYLFPIKLLTYSFLFNDILRGLKSAVSA